ncbi:MAG: GET complex subunit get1 [Geoglossum umbratile]|nr:MAG: GET complex subunit get1 [Geoglossum umbratile]
MPSLIFTVFLLQVMIGLVNTVGASTINNLFWMLYGRMPTRISGAVREQRRLQREVLMLRTEMNSTSSQDQFARWAKLRRQHDKAFTQYEKISLSVNASRASFEGLFTVARWLSINGLRIFIQFWYAKRAIFWIPQGWVPGYVEWLLAFPKAPRGSVSIQIWGLACASIISLVIAVVLAVYHQLVQGPKQPKFMAAAGTPRATAKSTTSSAGKDL